MVKDKKEISIISANSHLGEEEILYGLDSRRYTMKVYSLEATIYRLQVD